MKEPGVECLNVCAIAVTSEMFRLTALFMGVGKAAVVSVSKTISPEPSTIPNTRRNIVLGQRQKRDVTIRIAENTKTTEHVELLWTTSGRNRSWRFAEM